jgi:DNA-binding NarL/FixJ family response regulator
MARRIRVVVLRLGEGRSLFALGATIRPHLELPAASPEALERAAQALPEVIVVDGRGSRDAVAAIDAARARIPGARVVAVGDPGDDVAASAALAAGAFAWLGSSVDEISLRTAVQAAADGRLHFTRTGRRAAQRLLARTPR